MIYWGKYMESVFDLSFTNHGSIWAPDRSGTLTQQQIRGADYANELVRYMRATGNTVLHIHILRAMDLNERVEIGFLNRLGYFLASLE